MDSRVRAWLLIAVVLAACGGALGAAAFLRYRVAQHPDRLLERIPAQSATVFFVNVQALRQSGALRAFDTGAVAEEAEYLEFVQGSGFDYKRHLDLIVGSFRPEGAYFLLSGRFDWQRLQNYARQQGGVCRNTFCRMTGSKTERKISFFPVQRGVMALAVGSDEWGATQLAVAHDVGADPDRSKAVWISMPGADFAKAQWIPEAARPLVTGAAAAQRIVLSAGAQENKMRLGLEVSLSSEQLAKDYASRLQAVTGLLSDGVKKDPALASGLPALLARGEFRQEGTRVTGAWPLEQDLLDRVLGGR